MKHLPLLTVLTLLAATPLAAEEEQDAPATLADALAQPLLEENQLRTGLEDYLLSQLPRLPECRSATEWRRYAQRTRQRVLDEVVFRGEAIKWRDASTAVEWLDTLDAGPGYHIKKLRYEALPGLWIPALLYEPDELTGRVPVILNVNGHDGNGKAADYKQLRCINQAKRGIIALNVEWFGMGQLRTDSFLHYRANQLDLCGTPALAPFVLSMRRGLDLLLEHEHADPDRVAVTGLSGGGWQTMVISGLDPRVTLAVPVAGYGSATSVLRHNDLGDTEQSPTDLHTVAEYAHLTAFRAPNPTLLVYNAEDNCCFRADHTLQPLLDAATPIYRLFGKPHHLRWHVNHDPGDHNYGLDNRLALYRALGDYFYPGDASFKRDEIESADELLTADELAVPLPEDNADFNRLAIKLSESLPHDADVPDDDAAREKWQTDARTQLAQLIRLPQKTRLAQDTHYPERAFVDDFLVAKAPINIHMTRRNHSSEIVLPFATLDFYDAESNKGNGPLPDDPLAVVIADAGRPAAENDVRELVAAGHHVRVLDPFGLGESQAQGGSPHFLYALQVANIGDRPLGLAVAQVLAACWPSRDKPAKLVAVGPRASFIALVAAALAPDRIGELTLDQPLASLHDVIVSNRPVTDSPELFCFDLLRHFDVPQISALVAPRQITIRSADAAARKAFANYANFVDTPQPPADNVPHLAAINH